jgi:hypothetical protein
VRVLAGTPTGMLGVVADDVDGALMHSGQQPCSDSAAARHVGGSTIPEGEKRLLHGILGASVVRDRPPTLPR